jgi:hypothetical protein
MRTPQKEYEDHKNRSAPVGRDTLQSQTNNRKPQKWAPGYIDAGIPRYVTSAFLMMGFIARLLAWSAAKLAWRGARDVLCTETTGTRNKQHP